MLDKLRRAVIKEELVALTGSVVRAVILNQLIYWAERVSDFDKFKEQENAAARNNGGTEQELSAGWFYKTAEELSEETMLGITKSTMRTHLKALIDAGFLSERTNPVYKWDKTKQYRVNLSVVNSALKEIGYSLEGYSESTENNAESEVQKLNTEVRKSNIEVNLAEHRSADNSNIEVNLTEHRSADNQTAIPKTTTKTTTETTNKNISLGKADRAGAKKKDTVFEDFAGGNNELLKALKDFESMRKLIKKPLTERAKAILLSSLEKLSTDSSMQIKILEQSIVHNWQSVYALKENNNFKDKDKPQVQDNTADWFTNL